MYKRQLYLFRPAGRPAFFNEVALSLLIQDMIVLLKDAIGPLARYHPDFQPNTQTPQADVHILVASRLEG